MKIIVAGLPKTGTKTMNAAMTLLGFEVYDWLENFWYLGDDWAKQIREGCKVEDMRRMYENVDVVMDTPCEGYWEEILKAFPDSKVILTTREDESWYKSLCNQYDQWNRDLQFQLMSIFTYSGIRLQRYMALTDERFGTVGRWPAYCFTTHHKERLTILKKKHEKRVKQVVPQNQLLIYHVKEGWSPLCDFLDVPTPDFPFPHKNKGGGLLDDWRKENPIMQRMEKELFITLGGLFALIIAGVWKITSLIL